uniref:tRNA (adenine(58)-N(1))-methyltransferase non-catalytic subunit TRM6 n=1 Tax=Caenorhabditis japonica TaxID=281687 RepID=A0A8R1DKA5_CAEJA
MTPPTTDTAANIISNGQYLIVQKIDGEQSRIIRFTPKQKILIEKLKFTADSAFGKPYGLFEISSGQCLPMSVDRLIEELQLQEAAVATSSEPAPPTTVTSSETIITSDDRVVIAPSALKLEPEQKRQKLEMDAVLEMRKQGVSGQEMVQKLVEGSASFQTRTVFSQSKYIKRKAKKHSDSENSEIALTDLMGAVAQSIPCVHSMNYDEQTLSTFLPVRIKCVLAEKQLPYENNRRPANGEAVENNGDVEMEEKEQNEERKVEEQDQEALARRNDRLERERKGIEMIETENAHSLIIGSRTVDPISVLELLYAKLAPSASIVIYSPHQNMLITAYDWLVKRGAINLMLTDQMCRILQVLPDRTHPLMAQHVAGGHVLTAIKVIEK